MGTAPGAPSEDGPRRGSVDGGRRRARKRARAKGGPAGRPTTGKCAHQSRRSHRAPPREGRPSARCPDTVLNQEAGQSHVPRPLLAEHTHRHGAPRAAAGALRSQETSGLRSPCALHYALTDTALCVVRRGEGARHPVPGAQWADAPCAQPPAPLGSPGRVCGRGCGLSLPRHAPLCLNVAGARPRSLDLWASAHAAGVTPGLSAALCRPQSGAR